ncbi:MAG: EAL domain-containing protein [Patulibacter sp.]|nr:EAL domain-containing protein [Patulibacter sp.]
MHSPPEHAAPTASPPTVYAGGIREGFDLAPVPMVLLDASGHVVRVNFRTASLFGIAPEQLTGTHWTDYASPVDRAEVDAKLALLLSGEQRRLHTTAYHFTRPDGQVAWYRASTSGLFEEGQRPLLLVQLTDLGEERRAQARVAGMIEQHDRVAAVVSSYRNAIVATDVAGTITTWNAAMEELLGWKASDVLGKPLAELFPAGARAGGRTVDLIEETVRGQLVPRFAAFFPHADGHRVAVDCDTSQVLDSSGACIGFSAIFLPHDSNAPDARVRWMNNQQRQLSRLRTLITSDGDREEVEAMVLSAFASITSSSHIAICDLRDDGDTMRLRTAIGFQAGELAAAALVDHTTLIGTVMRTGESATRVFGDDVDLPPSMRAANVDAGLAVPVLVGKKVAAGISAYRPAGNGWDPQDLEFAEEVARIYADAITRWESESERRRLDLHDRLTGLPSLTLLVDRLEQALERDRALGLYTGLLVLDIDHFKFVNDTLGHDVGDRLLTAVVPRLQSVLRPGDTIARLSGDEFAIVTGEATEESDPMLLAETILDAFVEPFAAGGQEHVLSVSIGVTLGTREATAQEMLSDADAATFRAKELGRNRIEVFDRSLRERVTERVRTERELRGAVDRGELSLRYQPIVDLRTGFIEGVEALVRWQHPERGLVGPGDFIEIAEESGLIVGLGEWVLRTATKQAAEWLREYDLPRPFQLSVNLSARQLGNHDIVGVVVDALAASGLPATCLALEVTESVLIEQEDAVEILTDLRTRGVKIMLDDFGTGYSSLSYLRRFEVDALKIDRSFVSELGERRQDALLVSALVQMANALNIDAVAEGVETAQQAQMLRVLGCGLAQGFHFARPLTIEDATELMRLGGMVPGGKAR